MPPARRPAWTGRRHHQEGRPPSEAPPAEVGGAPGGRRGGEGVEGQQHPGEPRRPLDDVDVDDLAAHEAEEGEGHRPEGGGGDGHRLATEEQVGAGQGDVVDEGQVEGPGGLGGEDPEQPGGRVGGPGVEAAEQRGAAEDVGVHERQRPVVEVLAHQDPEGEVLDEVVAVQEDLAHQDRGAEHQPRDEQGHHHARMGPGPPEAHRPAVATAGRVGPGRLSDRLWSRRGGPGPGAHTNLPDHQVIRLISAAHWLRKKKSRMKGRNISTGCSR